ncbi:MAG: RNA methyltransferase [Candidatus Cloacimonadaceae bacterium]
MKNIFSFKEQKFKELKPARQLEHVRRAMQELEYRAINGLEYEDLVALLKDMRSWMQKDVGLPVIELEKDEPRKVALKAAAWLQEHIEAYRDADIMVYAQDGLGWRDDELYHNAQNMVVILEDLRSSFNVGSIFRTSECLGIKELWLCGITSKPGDKALAKTAMGTEARLAWRAFDTAVEAVKKAKQQGRRVYVLETVETAQDVFEASYELPLALVLGNEALGVSQEVLALCDAYISLPMQGWKNSLNVGVAFGVAGFHIARNAR